MILNAIFAYAIHRGDITDSRYYDARDIEILSIDMAKTADLMVAVALEFFHKAGTGNVYYIASGLYLRVTAMDSYCHGINVRFFFRFTTLLRVALLFLDCGVQ